MAKTKSEPKTQVTETPIVASDDTQYTEYAYGIARKKVKENGEERVRSYLVEIRYNPETGEASKGTMTLMEDSHSAANHFKVAATRNVFKF